MKRSNKKGFTIVELVIVIAVIAILASVLIPTIAGLVRDANISADTVLAKELNRVLAEEDAKDDASNSDFEAVLKTLRNRGYYIANLNARADECYFVWDDAAKQIILVDGREDYKVLYSNKEVSEKSNWFFAISDPILAASVEADGYKVKNTVANVSDLNNTIASADGEVVVYIDESLVIDKKNVIVINNDAADITIELGESNISGNNASTKTKDNVPFRVEKGTLNIKGGTIAASGAFYDADGDVVSAPVRSEEGSITNITNTTFDINTNNGSVMFYGDANLKDVKIDTNYLGVGAHGNAQVVLENVEITSTGRCVWATNYNSANGTTHESGTAKLTIKSGKYTTANQADYNGPTYPAIVAYSGDIIIEGGVFENTSNSDLLFQVMESHGSITITGGTFNGIEFENLTVEALQAMCVAGAYAHETADGFVINRTAPQA